MPGLKMANNQRFHLHFHVSRMGLWILSVFQSDCLSSLLSVSACVYILCVSFSKVTKKEFLFLSHKLSQPYNRHFHFFSSPFSTVYSSFLACFGCCCSFCAEFLFKRLSFVCFIHPASTKKGTKIYLSKVTEINGCAHRILFLSHISKDSNNKM